MKYLWFVNFKYVFKKKVIKLRKNSSFNWFTPFHVLIRPDVIWKKLSRPLYHVHFTVIHTNSRHKYICPPAFHRLWEMRRPVIRSTAHSPFLSYLKMAAVQTKDEIDDQVEAVNGEAAIENGPPEEAAKKKKKKKKKKKAGRCFDTHRIRSVVPVIHGPDTTIGLSSGRLAVCQQSDTTWLDSGWLIFVINELSCCIHFGVFVLKETCLTFQLCLVTFVVWVYRKYWKNERSSVHTLVDSHSWQARLARRSMAECLAAPPQTGLSFTLKAAGYGVCQSWCSQLKRLTGGSCGRCSIRIRIRILYCLIYM